MNSVFLHTTFFRRALALVVMLSFVGVSAQVSSEIDSTVVKIGEQITYKIQVESDSTELVVFPEGQTFLPLEVIESYPVDTSKMAAKFQLIKKYGLTQFDSGVYTIPSQKIAIGSNFFFTDSLRVEIKDVEVDTTKQKLYDIKPIIAVDKSTYGWLSYLLIGLLILGIIVFLMYWFIWRDKPLTKEEKIALLPPYDRAKLALKELDEAHFLERDELKEYYSQLTLIIRKYLDEKVYDHSLESTTAELIDRLRLLKDGNQIDLDQKTIKNIETILRRADLVKFAKSKPDKELAKLDRNTIDLEIDHVKESLPEPTEEERLADLKYQEELAQRKKRKRILITTIVSLALLIITFTGFSIHYGFDYVKDTLLGHPSKELLETKEWVTSEYGAPPVIITTPVVLERVSMSDSVDQQSNYKEAVFAYYSEETPLRIEVSNTTYNLTPEEEQSFNNEEARGQDLLKASEDYIKALELDGAQNITVKREQFITPNGQEGLKTFGSMNVEATDGKDFAANYILLHFRSNTVRQQVVLVWEQDDVYADEMIDRILQSVELLKIEDTTEADK